MTGRKMRRRRMYLRLARTANPFISQGPRYFKYPVIGIKPYRCHGCGATIEQGVEHAVDVNSGRVCAACVLDAVDASALVAPRRSAILTEQLMASAQDALEGRVTVLAIEWDDGVTAEEAHRLSKAWAARIGEKPVVSSIIVRAYGGAS